MFSTRKTKTDTGLYKLIYDLYGQQAIESLLASMDDVTLDELIDYMLNGEWYEIEKKYKYLEQLLEN